MDTDSFNDLALCVIAGEATDADRKALETELSAHPSLREEFDQLKITHAVLRTTAPMTEAARATEPALPAYRLNELRTAVRQHFGPASSWSKASGTSTLVSAFRWIFAGGGLTALTVLVIFMSLSNRTIEVGLYGTDLARGGDTSLSQADVPSATVITFDQDTPFDNWQNESLAWYERAKVWVDNENDLLHIIRREDHGHIVIQTLPLAPTLNGQRDQIKQVVQDLTK